MGKQKLEIRKQKADPPSTLTIPPSRRRTPFQRLRRRAFHLAALGSAVLLVVILMLWPVSYMQGHAISYGTSPYRTFEIGSWFGRLAVRDVHGGMPEGLSHRSFPCTFDFAWHAWSYTDRSAVVEPDTDLSKVFGGGGPPVIMEGDRQYKILGCDYSAVHDGNAGPSDRSLYIPYSYLALLSAIMPAAWLLTRKRRRLEAGIAKGLCGTCGYDLRGHAHLPDARCPECGTPVPRLPPA